uniref:Reverse transcriptase domain-containing protein n=1 Tax=Anolis carolinensis TaxID=28377 RepID=A0A803TII6_ANOCA
MEIRFFSNNVNGLNSPQKRKKIFNAIRKGRYDISALQETHISQKHISYLTQKSIGQEYFSSALEKKRGVVIYANPRLNTQLAFKDDDGRIVGIILQLDKRKILICNIYVPNGPKKIFVKKLSELIRNQEHDELIIMGDFNGIMDKKWDKTEKATKNKNKSLGQLPLDFMKMYKDLDLEDIWRKNHKEEKDYTYFSNRHQIWTRIDMIWASNTLTTNINHIKILPRTHTDHCPMEMILNQGKKTWKWRLNDTLLKEEGDIKKNKVILKEFFDLNETPEITIQTVWDTSKAVMRGYFIQQNSIRKKKKDLDIKNNLEEISKMENELKKSPNNKNIQQSLQALHRQRENLESEDLAKKLKFIKQHHYENANKPGKWLASKIRKKRQKQFIPSIRVENKEYLSDQEIMDQFYKFYKTLYTKDQIEKEGIVKFLNNQKLAKITDKHRELLNKEISKEELYKAIKKLDPSKAPGPDGFTAGYYKTFEQELSPMLLKIMNQAMQNEIIPNTWKEAIITLIHKEKSDPQDIKNYRPISLLNTDYKLFTNILAERLKTFLTDWIKEDQAGFLPRRQIRDNVRIILNAIEYYDRNNQKECAFLALDAEKAFDNINWDFIIMLLKELDMGHQYITGIKSIYTNQEAKICINGQETKKFNIAKGTRQGCPLSPLLFILSLEMLLNNIREDKELTGIKIRKEEYKIRAFADDMICIIENPLENIQNWLKKIEEFGKVSGLKINKNKTMIMTKNISRKRQEELESMIGIKVTNKIKYLGIVITPKNAQLLKNNYEEKWREIKKDMESWKQLNLSLLGRISTVKMVVLPKILFLFQTIPIIRNYQIFKKWNSDISKFIWAGKKARIKFLNLIDEKKRGGLGLPDLRSYYEACGLSWIKDWSNLNKIKILTLEGFDLRCGWHAYMWYEKRKVEKNFGNNFIRSALIKIWENYKARFYQKTPLWISPIEAAQRTELRWEEWPTYKDVLKKQNGEYILRTQEEVRNRFQKVSWFHYRQIQEYYNRDKKYGFADKDTLWDKIRLNERKEITKNYKILLQWTTETEQVKDCMIKWAAYVRHPINMAEWEKMWNLKLKYTNSYDLKENWYKMMYQWYMTPQKLAKCYKNVKDQCWKCEKQTGTFFHMWWGCKVAKDYWKKIHEAIQKIIKVNIQLRPEHFLLGITNMNLNRNQEILFHYLTTAARIVYAKKWKTTETPTKEEWILKIMDIKNMDTLTYYLKTQHGKPIKETDWTQLTIYIEQEKLFLLNQNVGADL